MSLSKVTSDNGSSLARFTADHAAVPLLGAPLPNSPDGFKDYVWAAVHILGVAIVAGSKSFACGPQLGKSDMHAAVLNKILLHWVENTQIRGQANQPLEHAHAVTAFLESADDEAKALAKLPFKYVPANNEPVTLIHSQPYVEGELVGDNNKFQGALFEVTNSRTGQTTALDLVKFVEKAGKSGIDFLNLIGPCSTPAERTDEVLKATVGVLLLTSLQTYLNRGGELDPELTDLVGKASQKERVLDFLDRTRDLPEGTEHVRMSEAEHVVLHVALRAAAIKMSEEFDQAALGTFVFSSFGAIIKANFTRIHSHPPPSPGTNRESRPPARSRLVVDVKTIKRIRENPNGPRTEFEARTGRHLSARPKSWAGLG